MRDDLGDKMKEFERATRTTLPRPGFTIIRVDGRAFHTFTRGLIRPFDAGFATAMNAAALALASEVQNARLAYVQSDEISVVCDDTATGPGASEPWFGGVMQKVVSGASAHATAWFNAAYGANPSLPDRGPATFDARAFSLPSMEEVRRYLMWRQTDASRNAISMIAEVHLGSRALMGVRTSRRTEMLDLAGVDVGSHDAGFLAGRLVARYRVVGPHTYRHRRSGELVTIDEVTRYVWSTGVAPRFSSTLPLDLAPSDLAPSDLASDALVAQGITASAACAGEDACTGENVCVGEKEQSPPGSLVPGVVV